MKTENASANDANERVIVRVWTSRDNQAFPGDNVGHISIETSNEYMSLWPVPFTLAQINQYRASNTLEQQYQKYFMERDSDWKGAYQEDYEAEGKQVPQVVVCLYSLNIDDIESAFGKYKDDTKAWRLIGSNMLVQKLETLTTEVVQDLKLFDNKKATSTVENCASLALKLLKAGGITNLVSFSEESSFFSQTSSAVSPDQMLKLLIPAKLTELDKFQETQKYQFEHDTAIDRLREASQKKSKCLLM